MTKLKDKIKSNIKHTKPKPKWQFTAKEILVEILIILLWITIVIGLGVLIYNLVYYNPWSELPSSFRYFWQGLLGMPLELMFALGIMMLITYYLFKKVRFIYRLNRGIIVGIILASLVTGYLIAEQAGVNTAIADSEPAQKIYSSQGRLINNRQGTILVGYIKDSEGNIIEVINKNGKTFNVLVSDSTAFPLGKKFVLGEFIKITGSWDGSTLEAISIQPLGKVLRGLKKQ